MSPPAPSRLHNNPAVGSYFPKLPTEPKTDWFAFQLLSFLPSSRLKMPLEGKQPEEEGGGVLPVPVVQSLECGLEGTFKMSSGLSMLIT